MNAFGRGPAPDPRDAARRRDWASMQQLASQRRFAEAIAVSERHLGPRSRDVDFMRARAQLERHAGHLANALRWAAAAEGVESHPDTLQLLARGEMQAGRTDQALAHARAALALAPDDARALLLVVEALESAMRLDEAAEALQTLRRSAGAAEPAIAARADHLHAALQVHRGDPGAAIETLDALLPRATNDRGRRQAWYLRAKACDRLGRYDDAFESAAKANAIGAMPFDPQAYSEAVDGVLAIWTRQAMRDFPSSRCESELPVFVAGMPRSGTSLLDQVIDAHGEAAGVGERHDIEQFAAQLEQGWNLDLPAPDRFGNLRDRAFRNAANAYLQACAREAPGAARVANKALGNNRILGLVARLFPRTRVIHALRDPRDVAVSCFMGGFNNANYPWTTRLDWIAGACAQGLRLMRHWQRELDVPILDVHYERLVTDPDTEFPRLVQFLGLPWDQGCRRFHESRRTVRTLSYDQVNRPLYATSVGRWRHYERFLRGIDWPEAA